MDFIYAVLFESPFRLGIFSFVVFAVVLFWRQRMESQSARRRAIPLTLLIFLLLFVMQNLVQTEREKILNRLDQFVTAIVKEQPTVAEEVVSTAYNSEDVGKEAFVDSLRDWFELIDVRDPRFARRDVTVEGDSAVMILGASATVSIHKQTGATHFAVFRITWQRESDGWRMNAITPQSIDMQPITSLRQLRAIAGQ